MKKPLTYFLIFVFIFSQISVAEAKNKINLSANNLISTENTIPHNISIDKKKTEYGIRYAIIDNDINDRTTPYCFEKIVRLGEDTVKTYLLGEWSLYTNNGHKLMQRKSFKNIYMLKIDENKPAVLSNSIFIGSSDANNFMIFIPSYKPSDFFREIFEQNNKISWIKFHNYPLNGTLIFKNKGKYGYLASDGDCFILKMPQYDDIEVPDKNSAVYKQFGISYAKHEDIKVKARGKWYDFGKSPYIIKHFGFKEINVLSMNIKENIETDGENLNITYISKENPVIPNIYEETKFKNNLNPKNINSLSLLDDIYKEYNSKNEFFNFYDYPSDGIIVTKNLKQKGLVLCKNKKYMVIPQEYDDFYFPDSNTLIYKTLGISYANQDRIFAKKNNKWGIIDRNNNIICAFEYDSVSSMPASEKFVLTDNIPKIASYVSIEFPQKDLYLLSKNNKYGVIDENGNIVIDFKEQFEKNNIEEIAKSKNEKAYIAGKNYIKKDFSKYKKMNTIGELMDSNFAIIHNTLIFTPAILVASIVSPILFYACACSGDGKDHPIINWMFNTR